MAIWLDAHCMLGTKGYKHEKTGFVILVTFPPQQCLDKSSMLRNIYIACMVLCLRVTVAGRLSFPADGCVSCICYGGPDGRDLPRVPFRCLRCVAAGWTFDSMLGTRHIVFSAEFRTVFLSTFVRPRPGNFFFS